MDKTTFISQAKNIGSMYDTNTPSGTAAAKAAMEKLCAEFFATNVVVPMGESPHPDALFIHLYAENPLIVFDYGYTIFDIIRDTDGVLTIEVLNEPPIFAWQWIKTRDGKAEITDGWLTEAEMKERYEDFYHWSIIPKTQKKVSDVEPTL